MKRSTVVLAGAMVVGLMSASAADAALMLTLSSSSTAPITITDGGAGDNAAPTGLLQNSQFSYGNFTVVFSLATSNSPGASTGSLTINNLTISSGTSGGDLTIRVSDTDYTNPGTNGSALSLVSNAGVTLTRLVGAATGTPFFTFSSYADPTNAGLLTNQVGPAAFVSDGSASQSFSNEQTGGFVHGPTAYSLTSIATFNLAASSSVQFIGTSTVVPEPTTLSMLGLGAMAMIRRRRA